ARSTFAAIPQVRACVLSSVERRRGRYTVFSFWMRAFSFSVLIVTLTVAVVRLIADHNTILSMIAQAAA
ncbi:MAG TPA: hypothetical protein VFZ66_24070, partial [Herpetosiphonaceae bacterium]